MTLPQETQDAQSICSLRFDGYMWLESRHPEKDSPDFQPYVDPLVDTLRLHSNQEANFAACFALQRVLCKWGGEMLPHDSREHVAWRYLFLHLYRLEVPVRFRHAEYVDRWDREFRQNADAHAALVREALLVNGPGRDVPITLDGTYRMNDDGMEIASWSLVSELVRRSPHDLRVIETHPGGGMSDCLTILNRSRSISQVNRGGSLHITGRVDFAVSESLILDIWPRFAAGESPRTILDEWCRHLGLTVPERLPRGSQASLTYRVIAAFLKLSVFGPDGWRCVNGFEDTSGWSGGPRDKHFAQFPAADARRQISLEGDPLQNPCYRFWFLEKEGQPKVCLESTGTAWLLDGSSFNLTTEYGKLRNVNIIAARLHC